MLSDSKDHPDVELVYRASKIDKNIGIILAELLAF